MSRVRSVTLGLLALGLLLPLSATPAQARCRLADPCWDRWLSENQEWQMESDRQHQEHQNQQAREEQWSQEHSDRQELIKELRRQNDLEELRLGGR